MYKERHTHTRDAQGHRFLSYWFCCFKSQTVLMAVFLWHYREPVAILESVVLNSTFCCSSYGRGLRGSRLDWLLDLSSLIHLIPPHPTSGCCHCPTRCSQHQCWQCPEYQVPHHRQKCPAVLWLRAGVILRWVMHDFLHFVFHFFTSLCFTKLNCNQARMHLKML